MIFPATKALHYARIFDNGGVFCKCAVSRKTKSKYDSEPLKLDSEQSCTL